MRREVGDVAPFTGAWIETWRILYSGGVYLSHPLRVRELKRKPYFRILRTWWVAPFTGAWIETFSTDYATNPMCRTLYGCVNWNRVAQIRKTYGIGRTLYGCVNWNFFLNRLIAESFVAPFTGAWIETDVTGSAIGDRSRTLYGCVNWNDDEGGIDWAAVCRTLYGCVNWNDDLIVDTAVEFGRTLYGCVNWNPPGSIRYVYCGVAPFTGAWIETYSAFARACINSSHPLRVRELKRRVQLKYMLNKGRTLYGCVNWNHAITLYDSLKKKSHPLRVRELKPQIEADIRRLNSSHPLRVRELKHWKLLNWHCNNFVAPFTGAWIETWNKFETKGANWGRTLYGCVNWNNRFTNLLNIGYRRTLYGCVNWNCWQCRYYDKCWVAPFTGAWIETGHSFFIRLSTGSHPLRVRELKREICVKIDGSRSRTLYGCVNWNRT